MNMEFSAHQIASLVQGRIEGNPERTVTGFAKIEEAGPENLAFMANPKYEDYLYSTKAGIIIVGEQLNLKQEVNSTLIRVKDAYSSFASLMQFQQQMQSKSLTGIQDPVFIHPTARIGEKVFIGAFSYIGENAVIGNNTKIHPQSFIGNNVSLGQDTVIHAGVKIYHDCAVGNKVIIHAGTVVGSDGFGFAPQEDGSYQKVPQLGNVVVEDEVEIGANTCIDRATMGSTIIRKGTKLDNLLQIAHNVEVGENSVIAAQTGISGSTKIGKNVMIGGQVGVVGHITVADGTKVNGQSGITRSVTEPNTSLNGTPAFDYKSTLRSQAIYKRLPFLEKRIHELEQMVQALLKEKAC
jgi:UDP-3-O-[3-hydroxymyristoyl] glucosamine N-acyltransferase